METSFGDRFTENDTRERRLPPHLLAEFYDRLKGLVVFIQAEYYKPGTRPHKQKERQKVKTGAGLIMSKDCVILTCSRVVPQKVVSVHFSFEENRDELFEADVIHRSAELDLAILLPKKNTFSRNYAVFAPDDALFVGMKVYTIYHLNSVKYAFSCGDVTYPTCRLKGEVIYEYDPNDSDGSRLRLMGKGCELIQINNFHGIFTSFGSPVFDSRGRIVGLNSFIELKFDLAVHVKTIKDFWNSNQTLIGDRRRERIKTTQPMEIESSSKGASSSTKRGTIAYPPSTGKSSSKGSSTKSVGEVFGISKASYQNTQGMQNADDSNNKTIFVGDLNDSVSDEQLRQFFSPYGQLVHVKILVGKRCGLVQFADSHCADVALEILNGTQLGGQNIRLPWGRSPSNKQVVSSKIIQNKQSSQPECYGPSQSPTSEDMEESTRTKEIFSYYYEPAYGPVPPSEPSQDWQQMDVHDPMQGQALAGGYQGEWHDYQYADQLAYREQYLLQTNENYDVQTGLNILLDPRLITQEEKDRGLGSASKCDNQRLQQLRERDSWEKDPNFISDSYSECYPGYQEFNCEIVDSDDEANLSKMDMGGRVLDQD